MSSDESNVFDPNKIDPSLEVYDIVTGGNGGNFAYAIAAPHNGKELTVFKFSAQDEAFFIREDDEIVGMLCVNTDLSTVRSINAMAQQLMACFDAAPTRTEPAPIEVESLSESTQELIDRSIAELLSARGLDVASLGQSDRVDVIRHLNGNGVFMLKGAVACAATALGISEPSVYRYLQKVRKEG